MGGLGGLFHLRLFIQCPNSYRNAASKENVAFCGAFICPKPVLIEYLVPQPEAPIPTIIRVLCVLNLAFIVLTVIARKAGSQGGAITSLWTEIATDEAHGLIDYALLRQWLLDCYKPDQSLGGYVM